MVRMTPAVACRPHSRRPVASTPGPSRVAAPEQLLEVGAAGMTGLKKGDEPGAQVFVEEPLHTADERASLRSSAAANSSAARLEYLPRHRMAARRGRRLKRRSQLLAQALHGLGLAAHAQVHALAAGALLQHRAAGGELPAQLLRRPGEVELGLGEALLEEGEDRLAQLRHLP